MRIWIFGHVPPCLTLPVTDSIVRGLEAAVESRKSSTTTNRELGIIVTFIDLVMNPSLDSLNIDNISKILRTNLYDKLSRFVGLRRLVLGSGTGGWSNMYVAKFAAGVQTMKYLVKFSLCYDCTDSIIKIVIRNCKRTLKILDVEMSNQVTDDSASWIAQVK